MKRLSSVALVIFAGAALLVAGSAGGEPSPASRLFELANSERAATGLAYLAHDGDLAGIATRHSRQMAESGRLEHNPNLGREANGWKAIGENVGKGIDADQVHRAFMSSSVHRAQILDGDYKGMAVGVATSADTLWVTQIFILRQPISAPVTKPIAKPKAPRPRRTTPGPPAPQQEKLLVRRPVRFVAPPRPLEVPTLRQLSPESAPTQLPLPASALITAYLLALLAVMRRLTRAVSAERVSAEYVFERGWTVGHYSVNAELQ